MQVDFYHLTASPVEAVLPRIAERVLEEEKRLLIVAEHEALAALLDSRLWTYRPESFLPHGRTGGADDAAHPILIADRCVEDNGATAVALADGVWRADALRFERAFLFFGEDRIAEARDAWKSLGERAEVECRYWKQTPEGKWQRER